MFQWISKIIQLTTLFEVSLFRFILFLHLSIYVITINIQWSKQPPYPLSSLWNLHFFIFGKLRKKLIYFWIPRQNSSMEGDEVGIFSNVPDWKPLFLLKIKVNKTQAAQTKTSSSTLFRISRPILKVKNLHRSMIMKIFLHIQNSSSKVRL